MRCLRCLRATILFLSLLAWPASPQAQTPAMDNVVKMITNLGYETKVEGKSHYFVEKGLNISFHLSGDETILYLNLVYDIPSDRVKQMPVADLLNANESNMAYFFLVPAGGRTLLGMGANLPVRDLTPEILREEMRHFLSAVIANQRLMKYNYWR